jgi:hypothetical protein
LTLAEAVALAGEAKDERALADLRREVGDDTRDRGRSANYQGAGGRLPRDRTASLQPEDRAPAAGLEDTSPACRGSALLSLELLSRDHPGLVNGARSLLHSLANDDPNPAVRRLAVLSLKNGSPTPDTITLLAHIGEEADERELRQTATAVHQSLKKKAATRWLRRRCRQCAPGRRRDICSACGTQSGSPERPARSSPGRPLSW